MKSLGDIQNSRTRNIVRGLLSRDIKEHLAAATINNLINTASDADISVLFELIFTHPLFSRLPVPEPFPTLPPVTRNLTRLDFQTLGRAVEFQLARIRPLSDRLVSALDAIHQLNSAIVAGDIERAVELARDHPSGHGYSLVYLRKIAFLNAHYPSHEEIQTLSREVFLEYGFERRNIVALAVVDPMDSSYMYVQLRRSMLDYVANPRINQTARDIVDWVFRPIKSRPAELTSQLQSHGLNSALDALLFILCHRQSNRPFAAQPFSDAIDGLDPRLHAEWSKLANSKLPMDAWYAPDDPQFGDVQFYRQSAAWIENEGVAQFRELMDPLYLDNKTVDRQITPNAERLADAYFSELPPLPSLAVHPDRFELHLDRYNNETAGMLARTAAIVRLVRSGAKSVTLTSDELVTLMDNAADLSTLLTLGELRDFFQAAPPDHMHRYIAEAIVSDASGLNVDRHRYRRILQQIVLEDHGGDLVAFVKALNAKARNVGLHLYGTLTEAFLVQLFGLFEKTDQVYEVRAELLEWYGGQESDPSSTDRAASLRVDQLLQRIRGDIDDVRMYVDPLRFDQWLADNTIEAISSALRTSSISDAEIREFREAGNFIDQRKPLHQLATVLQRGFNEFCSDKRYGVDSYIGRRIRHGTLKGFMFTQLLPIFSNERHEGLLAIPEIARYVDKWLDDYSNHIAHWGNETFQVRSKAKPQGLILPTISTPARTERTRTALRDMISAYQEEQNIGQVHQAIFAHCWHLLETDLALIRAVIDDGRRTWGYLKSPPLLKLAGTEFRKEISKV